MSRYQTIDLNNVKTYSVTDRASKVDRDAFAVPIGKDSSFAEFWDSLPDFLAVRDLREVVRILIAARSQKPILWMMGAHPLKVGLSRLLIDLVRAGYVTSLSSHGAFAVHDSEIAMFGKTSEEVADTIRDGRFGMARETGEFFVRAVNRAHEKRYGLGEALGDCLIGENAPFVEDSLLAQCLKAGIPLTIHTAIGTDIVYEHPHLSGAAVGEASYRDFLIYCKQVSGLCEGAAVLNFGSAVIMPEVFLKALSVARNLGHPCHGFITANFDMLQHYRPTQNVVRRPTATGGKGYSFTGHHEFMLPLLAAALRTQPETH